MNDDILRHICEFLPLESLKNASIVHHVFFECWLRHKYQRIDLTQADKQSKRFWVHLRENTWIADSVKCVHIKPWLVKPRTQTYQSRTENTLNMLAMVFNPDYTKSQLKKRIEKRLKKDIGHVKSVFAALRNVQEYHIEWDNNPNYHTELFLEFLKSGLTNWRDTLTSLTVHIPVDMLNSLATVTLPQLQHIHICLSSGKMSERRINIHLDGFMVFLHNLKDTLTSISIQSDPGSENIELSRFYRFLGTFPHLRAISLTIPFDGAQLLDPKTFCLFIQKHSRTLQALSLKTTRCAVHSEPVAPECVNWIQTIIGSIQEQPLPELRCATIALRPLRAPLDILSNFLLVHASTLVSVTLVDRTLDMYDLRRHVLSPLSTVSPVFLPALPIKTLEVRVDSLTPQLLDLLAKSLPGLRTLKLGLANKAPMSEYALRRFERDLEALGFNGADWDLERMEIVSPASLPQAGGPGQGNGLWVSSLEKILANQIRGFDCVEEVNTSV